MYTVENTDLLAIYFSSSILSHFIHSTLFVSPTILLVHFILFINCIIRLQPSHLIASHTLHLIYKSPALWLYYKSYFYTMPYICTIDSSSSSSEDEEPSGPTRLTPAKFPLPHVTPRILANGCTIEVQPNQPEDGQPATISVVKRLSSDPSLIRFPGPLIKWVYKHVTRKHVNT